MSESIKDGTGTGKKVKVNDRNHLLTEAIITTELHDAVHRGKMWNVGTGFLTLTGDGTSHGMLYIKNTGTKSLFLDLYVFLTRASTGGSGDMLVEILMNPTAGTVVSDATVVTATKMNLGSANEPDALIYSGGQGKTLSGQDDILRSLTTASNRLLLGILTEITPSKSIGLRVTTPSGNTSIDVETVIELFEEAG